MNKTLFIMMIALMSLMSLTFVSATQIVSVSPFTNVELPQVTSNVSLDTEGISRNYLYCTWRLGDQGVEAEEMTGEVCPPTPINHEFINDENYYVRTDWVQISYSELANNWTIITSGNSGVLDQRYQLNIIEPHISLLNTSRNLILSLVRGILCSIFPSLGFCP